MNNIPSQINTGCPELDEAWERYCYTITEESDILIPDTEDALNWHAFLGHSIDMQGFRAAEFAGVDKLSKPAPGFIPLNQIGIGIPELGSLWDIPAVRNHLLHNTQGTSTDSTYAVLKAEGGKIGLLLAQAFENFPFRKGHWCIRAFLQNSNVLKKHDYSFRSWLKTQCLSLNASNFPPQDFRQHVGITGKTIEESLCKILENTFYKVGPQLAPYMICDWQLWLWKENKTMVFDNFKLDSFHEEFVKKINNRHGFIIPEDKRVFLEWWHSLYPQLPPRLANECIWLYVDDGFLRSD